MNGAKLESMTRFYEKVFLYGAIVGLAWWALKKKKEAAPPEIETVEFQMGRQPLPDVELPLKWSPEVVEAVAIAKAQCRDANAGAPVQKVAECAASTVFPDFPWPPVHGDHASAWEVWRRFVGPEEEGSGEPGLGMAG